MKPGVFVHYRKGFLINTRDKLKSVCRGCSQPLHHTREAAELESIAGLR